MDSLNCGRPGSRLSTQEFDLVVVGGGITGAGIAQDAASRGLRTVLFEKGDFASGTSSKSTKLIHGGLRYLENLQILVTLESVRERQLQQSLAPHMVWSVPFVIPTYRSRRLKNLKMGLGLWIYDLMAAGVGKLRRHGRLSRKDVLERCPGINADGLTGGYVYYDCRTDDARHTLEVLKSACAHGALAFNYAKVTGLVRESGRLCGVEVVSASPTDNEGTGAEPVRVRARAVVNATGVWMQDVFNLGRIRSNIEVAPAKGVHITLRPERLPLQSAMIVPSVHDKRFCFAIPWYDSVVVGTTDTAYEGSLDDVRVEPHEVRYILDALNAQFPGASFSEADVTGTFAGLRPLIKEKGASSTADLSRQHRLDVSPEGLVSISGGKLTTYRRMARETVDMIVRRVLPPGSTGKIGPCITDRLMLGGWASNNDVPAFTAALKQAALRLGLEKDTVDYLPSVYGKASVDILNLIQGDSKLAARLVPGHPYVMAQVLYAVWAEGALTIEDVLSRRIRLEITDRAAALAAAAPVAEVLAQELGWSDEVKVAQLDNFRKGW